MSGGGGGGSGGSTRAQASKPRARTYVSAIQYREESGVWTSSMSTISPDAVLPNSYLGGNAAGNGDRQETESSAPGRSQARQCCSKDGKVPPAEAEGGSAAVDSRVSHYSLGVYKDQPSRQCSLLPKGEER
jgi:hypothetical protein